MFNLEIYRSNVYYPCDRKILYYIENLQSTIVLYNKSPRQFWHLGEVPLPYPGATLLKRIKKYLHIFIFLFKTIYLCAISEYALCFKRFDKSRY